MEALYLLLILSVVFVALIGWLFWWAVFSDQFSGSDEAARSILLDDDNTEVPPDQPAEQGGEPSDPTRRDD